MDHSCCDKLQDEDAYLCCIHPSGLYCLPRKERRGILGSGFDGIGKMSLQKT